MRAQPRGVASTSKCHDAMLVRANAVAGTNTRLKLVANTQQYYLVWYARRVSRATTLFVAVYYTSYACRELRTVNLSSGGSREYLPQPVATVAVPTATSRDGFTDAHHQAEAAATAVAAAAATASEAAVVVTAAATAKAAAAAALPSARSERRTLSAAWPTCPQRARGTRASSPP